MAFLIDIGTGSVGKLVNYMVESVGHQVGYLIYYNRNVKSLEDQLNDLVAASQSVEQRVGEEERNVREVEVPVNKWLTDVKKITGEANEILNEEQKEKMKCLCGLFPNLVVRHQLSRKSTKLVSDVAELIRKQKDFSTYAHAIIPQDVPSKDYEAFSSRTVVVNQIMNELRNSPNINMIGVYGFGGVGKTTLVKEVSRQATRAKTGDEKLFDDVAMILDVKQNPSIQRIQQEIAEKLGLNLPENKTVAGRACLLSSRIKDKNTLVILDDVWDGIDLEAVGLSGVTTCKVLLTSRTREVLAGKMHTQKEFALDLLGEEESWSLFEKKAGDVVKDPSIKAVATKVAKKCGGLPVLVVSVASALKNRSTLHAWKDALTRLKRLDKEEFTEKTYLALEWSYSQLNDEELKQLFLLCGLYADSSKTIHIQYLLKYGIGLGLFKILNTLGEAWDAVNSLLDQLKDSCLLLDHENSQCVKMHDLIHDVAKRISSRDQHLLKVFDGDEFKEWPDNKDFCDKCTMISLRTSNIPKLPEVLQCKELKFFHLNSGVEGYSLELPCNLFKETEKLGVLDLSCLSIPSLPPSVQFLINLKTLCLDGCTLGDIALIGQLRNLEVLSFLESMFKELPKEVGQLTHLRSLDLTGCTQLEIIAPGVISNLKRLEELWMGGSFNRWEAEGVTNSERSNANLSELKHLSNLSALHVHVLDANILPSNLFSNALERYRIYIGAAWNWDINADANLNTLKIKLTTTNELYQSGLNMLLKRTDELHLNGMDAGNNTAYQLDGEEFQQLKHLHVRNAEFRHIINGKGVFPNLKRLVVSGLDGSSSRFLLSSSMATSLVQLTHLEISGCPMMEEIVSINEYDERHMKDMFSKLQRLELIDLPILTRFCSRSCTGYPSLEILQQPENYDEVEERDSRENIQNALFDAKVVFPSLKGLVIDGLTKLMTVWHNQISPESFKNIETVKIYRCQSLKSVFPSSMVRNLDQQLMDLCVADCGVEEIIEDGIQTTYDQFVLSKLNSFRFEDLPNLNCFYPGMHASCWPSLEALWVFDCSKIAFLAQERSRLQRNYESMYPAPTNQALFIIEKDSFPNLKKVTISGMEIWDGPFPVNYFSKLEIFQVLKSNNESAAILEKFPGLEKYGETSVAPSSEIFSHRKSRSGDIQAVGALSHLSELWLCDMSRLMHLGEDNSQMAGQNFPNLQILGIYYCDSLRNLRSSAISFKNLTNLRVNGCSGLEYLITYSTAKSLKQLVVLLVKNCARLVEIVGSREDDDNLGNEIVFSRLKNLELSKLPRLRGFCSGDCIVKFPSLNRLLISKRLKLKIFGNDETLHVTNEEVDTDVDGDDGEIGVDLDHGEKTVQVTKENVDIDAGVDGDQSDETTHITNEKEDENYDGSEHIQPLEITATDQGVIAPVGENLAILPVGEVTTPVFPVIEHTLVAEVTHTEAVEQVFLDIQPLAEEAWPDVHQTLNEPEQHVKERSAPLEPSAAAKGILTPTVRAQAPQSSLKSSGKKLSLIVLLFTCSLWICIYLISLPHLTPGSICTSLPLCHVINPFHYLTSQEVRPFETTATDQEFIVPVQENNLAIIPVGEVRTPVFPVIEPPPVVEVPHTEEREQAFSGLNLEPVAEAATPDAHQTSNAPEQNLEVQSDPFEPSAVARITPTLIIPALPSSSSPKSSRAKRSLGEKLQDLSAKKAASNIGQSEEERTKLKALISSAELRDPQTRQQLLAVLPTLQRSTTKWIADLVVQELSKLPLVLDKEESLRQKLAGLVAQGLELDERRHILLSEGSLAEENIQKVQEQKVELLALEEHIKKLEAQATSLRAEIAIGEKRYSGFEASLDQLVEKQNLNQLSVDSTSEELLRTRAVSDSLCTAIFTHLRQLL